MKYKERARKVSEYVAAAITFFGLLLSWALAPETRSLNLQQAAALG